MFTQVIHNFTFAHKIFHISISMIRKILHAFCSSSCFFKLLPGRSRVNIYVASIIATSPCCRIVVFKDYESIVQYTCYILSIDKLICPRHLTRPFFLFLLPLLFLCPLGPANETSGSSSRNSPESSALWSGYITSHLSSLTPLYLQYRY